MLSQVLLVDYMRYIFVSLPIKEHFGAEQGSASTSNVRLPARRENVMCLGRAKK